MARWRLPAARPSADPPIAAVDAAAVEAQNVDRAAYGIGRDRHSAGQRLDIHQPDVRPMGVERLDGVKSVSLSRRLAYASTEIEILIRMEE